tara:strand:- start:396 stop:896 length:501 start_codon:yes stop_codon:yes gene_type:complete
MISCKEYLNGRINIMGENGHQFQFADKIPVKEITSYNSALRGTWNETPLSILFFSKENITLLQNSIKKGVYELSKQQYVIGDQNSDELKIIMRSIYLQESRNLPNDITSQIKGLNEKVITYSVKQIYEAAISYIKYKRDVSYAPSIIQHPINSSHKGNTLELKSFI